MSLLLQDQAGYLLPEVVFRTKGIDYEVKPKGASKPSVDSVAEFTIVARGRLDLAVWDPQGIAHQLMSCP